MPDLLSNIVRVDLTESLSGALNSILEVLVDSREIDRGDRRSKGGLNGFPAVKGEMGIDQVRFREFVGTG